MRTPALSPEQLDRLNSSGAVIAPISADLAPLEPLFTQGEKQGPGRRLFEIPETLLDWLSASGPLGRIAQSSLSSQARPIRVLMFDKTPNANWAVPWHQDRTIAVKGRHELDGYTVWSTKQGVPHVEPPFELMRRMVSLRLHFDETGIENAPLITASGTHRLGKVDANKAASLAESSERCEHIARRGEVLVLRTAILHASGRAERPGRRRVLHIDYCDQPLPSPLKWALNWPD